MDTPHWHRDTTLLALATSLDHMLTLNDRKTDISNRSKLNATMHSRHSSSTRRVSSKVTLAALDRRQTVASQEAS